MYPDLIQYVSTIVTHRSQNCIVMIFVPKRGNLQTYLFNQVNFLYKSLQISMKDYQAEVICLCN